MCSQVKKKCPSRVSRNTSTTKSWKMLSNEPQIHQAKAGRFRSGRRGRRNRFSRKHSALPFLPTSAHWKPGMSWFTYADLSHCYQVPLQPMHAHPPLPYSAISALVFCSSWFVLPARAASASFRPALSPAGKELQGTRDKVTCLPGRTPRQLLHLCTVHLLKLCRHWAIVNRISILDLRTSLP